MNWRAIIGFELSWLALAYWQHWALIPVMLYWLFGMLQLTTKEKLAVLVVLGCGLVIDSALMLTGVLVFPASFWLPVWFVALWAIFALAAIEVMSAMLTKRWLAAGLGAIGGPVSYIAGASISQGALQFNYGYISYFILAIVWAFIAIGLGFSRRFYA